jgi:hypothetical protein
MARRGTQYVELDGPLFDPEIIMKFKGAVSAGIRELADEGVEILQAYTWQGGFVDSGDWVTSIHSEFIQNRGIGYAKVLPSAPLPPRIWGERGTRRGVKLRKGVGMFRKTKTRLRQLSYEQFFGGRIRRVLN